MVLFAAAGNANPLQDRLTPVLTGDVNAAVDTFIIGTHDRYIATVVRDFDQEEAAGFSMPIFETVSRYDPAALVFIEKMVFDKNAKRFSLAERYIAVRSSLHTIASEPTLAKDMEDVTPGSREEKLWDAIAGRDGLGNRLLGECPEPVALSAEDKKPVDKRRYAVAVNEEAGGIFLDKGSIKKTDEGCSATVVQAFAYDEELVYGGVAAQYTRQPHVDAQYAVTTDEYSFTKKAQRRLQFTVFSSDGKVIYSIRSPNAAWVTADKNPALPYVMYAVRDNLPKDVLELLSDDIKSFDAFVQERIEKAVEARKAREEFRVNGTTKKTGGKSQGAGTATKK